MKMISPIYVNALLVYDNIEFLATVEVIKLEHFTKSFAYRG